jgi:cell wall-associated NlpC family hydrolase
VVAALVTCLVVAVPVLARPAKSGQNSTTTSGYVMRRLSSPARTLVFASDGLWRATFTDGALTVNLHGARRTFTESTTTATVTSDVWVRLLGQPFSGTVDTSWLDAELADGSPDVLALAMQYVTGAPAVYDDAGAKIGGDSDYGPLQADGTRAEGSDFNDYLGMAWTYPSGTVDQPEADQFGSLDCSGYVRMVFGYRADMPLSLSPDDGRSIPRTSYQIAAAAPGIVVLPNAGVPPLSRSALQPGDLVFFDAATADGTRIDHVGIFLGRDSAGHDRFLSSRKTVNGPTLGDVGGRSILDGTGLYAVSFREARRL